MFNIDKLTKFAIEEIEKFAQSHQQETFYGFSIDARMLCLNSVEEFQKSLAEAVQRWEHGNKELVLSELTEKELAEIQEEVDENIKDSEEEGDLDLPLTIQAYIEEENEYRKYSRKKGNPYLKKKKIKELKLNTGDWAYQGFAEMTPKVGFDSAAYDRHYYMSDERQKTSAYGKAMDELVKNLIQSGVFSRLKTTDDFFANRVEHIY